VSGPGVAVTSGPVIAHDRPHAPAVLDTFPLDRRGRPVTGRRLVQRMARRVVVVGILATAAGVAFVFSYLAFIVPSAPEEIVAPGEGDRTLLEVTGVVVAFLAIAVPLTHRAMHGAASRRLQWLEADRRPTDLERRRTLGLPARMSLWFLLAWLFGAGFFTAGAAIDGSTARQIVRTGVTITMGGLVTATIVYLAIERIFRPLFARALAGDPLPRARSRGVRPRLLFGWAIGSGLPFLALALLPVITLGEEGVDLAASVLAVSVAGLVTGGLITAVTSRSIADPLRNVRRALAKVRDGDLDVHVEVDSSGEIGELQSGVNTMVAGLRERRRIEDLFGHHVGEQVVRRALESGARLQNDHREASALFVDLVASSKLVASLPADEVVERLNATFDVVVRCVDAEGGWVNKFEGDGALCVFGAPGLQLDHAARALRAARSLCDGLRELARRYPEIDAGIGVSSGPVVAGDVGARQRYEYTVIGRPVHEAARLTDLAKERPGRVLASGATIALAGDEADHWRPAGTETLRGQPEPTELHEPLHAGSGRR
jgi:adenylate cyclase